IGEHPAWLDRDHDFLDTIAPHKRLRQDKRADCAHANAGGVTGTVADIAREAILVAEIPHHCPHPRARGMYEPVTGHTHALGHAPLPPAPQRTRTLAGGAAGVGRPPLA